MKVRLSSEARRDLIEIGDYIARDNPSRARSFVRDLIDICTRIGDRPLSHPVVPRYAAKAIRRRMHGHYQIFYRVDDEQAFILRVLHGACDHDALL